MQKELIEKAFIVKEYWGNLILSRLKPWEIRGTGTQVRGRAGEENYFVMPMATYKEVIHDIPYNVGVLVPVPVYIDKYEEFENPTELSEEQEWKLYAIRSARPQLRTRSMAELLFCMLRSGK